MIRRAVDKWLKAGVLEQGQIKRSGTGTPQGGVISPLLANIYLHEVLDTWFEQEVKPKLEGEAFLVRFADDFVIVTEYGNDARRILEVLPKRLAKFGLTLHPDKTRLVDFRRPPTSGPGGRIQPGTFDLLGFTHYWGFSRKGRSTVKRRTAKKRLSRAIKKIAQWCRRNRHLPVRAQHRKLCQALRGHDAYYGITGNVEALKALRYWVNRAWRKWLNRRSRKTRMSWEKFNRLLERYPLPPARVVHSVYRCKTQLELV